MNSRVLLSHRARRVFVWLHLWLGLILGVWFSLIGVTGSVLAWRSELSAMELSRKFPVEKPSADAPIIPLSQAVAAMKKAHPQAPSRSLATVTIPHSRMPFYSFSLGSSRANMETVVVDPYSARVHPPVKMRTLLVGTTQQFHQRLIAGPRGYLVNGALTALSIPLLLSGLWLWWPTKWKHLKARLTVKRGVSLKRTLYDLHNVTGIYLYLVLFVTTLTGALIVVSHVAEDGIMAMWNQPPAGAQRGGAARGGAERGGAERGGAERGSRAAGESNRVLDSARAEPRQAGARQAEARTEENRLVSGAARGEQENRAEPRAGGTARAGGRESEAAPSVVPQGKRRSDDGLVELARNLRTQNELTRVKIPQRDDQALEATYLLTLGMQSNETVFIDPYAKRILKVVEPRGSSYMQWTRGLHFGVFGGVVSKVLYTLAGLAPLGLFVTGALLWWRKFKHKRTRKSAPELVASV